MDHQSVTTRWRYLPWRLAGHLGALPLIADQDRGEHDQDQLWKDLHQGLAVSTLSSGAGLSLEASLTMGAAFRASLIRSNGT